VAATCGALSITSPVASKLLGAPFSLVLKCASKPLQMVEMRGTAWFGDRNYTKREKGEWCSCAVAFHVWRTRSMSGVDVCIIAQDQNYLDKEQSEASV